MLLTNLMIILLPTMAEHRLSSNLRHDSMSLSLILTSVLLKISMVAFSRLSSFKDSGVTEKSIQF